MADLDQHLVLPIHDELLLDVPTESAGEIALEVQRLMEDHMGFLVPITAGFDIMPNRWGDKSRDG
jgi:DNA polymerase I-like protein with 3'-5' exonuclease and polymerase domains